VIQQGLDVENRYARRYHWLSENVDDFVNEPHDAILGDLHLDKVLDMTSNESENVRKIAVDLVNDNPRKIQKHIASPRPSFQSSMDEWIKNNDSEIEHSKVLTMPTKINWGRLRDAYEVQPKDFEELINIKGIGPSTVRALALISELVYGESPSWEDPVKFSFTVGGKDGVPYPVDRKTMDKSIQILKQGISESKLGNQEKISALKRLRKFVPPDIV
jgi:hypothetical protein